MQDLPGDWQPLRAANDALPLGFWTQPLEDLLVVEPVLEPEPAGVVSV